MCKNGDKRKPKTQHPGTSSGSGDVQQLLTSYSSTGRKMTQKDLDSAIVDYISDAVLPFHHVDSSAFQV